MIPIVSKNFQNYQVEAKIIKLAISSQYGRHDTQSY